jgi:hypothetical protein
MLVADLARDLQAQFVVRNGLGGLAQVAVGTA